MKNSDWLKAEAEKQGMPLRTLEQAKEVLAKAKKQGSDAVMARMMLNHGRLTDEAREYVAREYPQGT